MAFTASVSGTVSSELISSGVQNVYSGGIAVSCAIINGGWQYLYDDGVASYTKVDSAGRQIVSSGGTAFYTLINNNGAQLVEGAASGVIITSGGYQGVGGMADTVIISSGGMQFIQSHGTANSTLISSGGSQFINSAGSATNTNISGGNQIIGSGGIAALTTLSVSGQQNIYAGGTADSTLISSGGAQHVSGIANSTIVYSGGLQLVESGGTANSAIISSGGNQSIISGGTASSSMIDFCGNQMVESGGTANFTAIYSGGAQNIQSKGVANATIISAGGTQTVSAGGVANNTYNYGMQKILSGGVASNVVVNSGGGMYVSAGGGFGGALTINGGGHVTVDHPGNFEPVAVNIKLANARANDAIMIIQANVDNVNGTLLAVDVSNTLSGLYILTYGTNLTGMNGAMFAVKDGVQTVNVKVGSSYTFADGDKLSLGFTDGITDKLTATFTVKGEVLDLTAPTVPTGLKAALTGDTLGLTWNDSTDAGGIKQYELWGDEYSDFSSPLENGYHKFVSETKDAIPNMEAGVYYMKVRAQDNGGNWSNWSTSVSTTVFGTLAINSTVKGYVGSTDFYKLTLGNAGTLNLSLTGLTANADLVLLTATGTVLKTSANTGNSNEAINGVALLAGNYYVKVGPSGKIDTDYTLGNTFNALPADTAANDYMTAKNIDAGVDNWVGFGDAADFYKLTMTNAGLLNVGLTGLTGNADLSLLSSTGAVLKSNIKAGIASEGISDAALLAGTYYVKVAAATGVNGAGYTLTHFEEYSPADTGANTWQTAKDINAGVDNWVGFGDAADFYKLTMTNAGILTLGLSGLTGNADMALLSPTGTVLKTSANTGLNNEAINNVALPVGTYYIKVTAGTGVNDASYTLTNLKKYTPADTAANTWQTAKDINAGVDNWVGFGDAADFYKLTMTNAGILTLGLSGLTGNADMALLSPTGTVLKTSANTGLNNEAINSVALLAGTYYVKVAAATGVNDAGYILTHLEKYTPADTGANTWQTAKNIDAGVDNWVGFGDAADFYKLTMINAGMLNVGLSGLTGNADLSLLSSTGAVLKSNIKTGIASEGISDAALLAGTYYVKVAAATGVNDAGYTLINQINYFPGDTYDKAGNTSAMAKLVDGPAQTGWVGMGDSDDLYKFVFDASVQGTIRLYDLKSGNADLSLYNDKGTLLKKSSKLGILEDTITSTLAAGTYYAKVNAVSGNSIDYKLDFTKNNVAGMLAG